MGKGSLIPFIGIAAAYLAYTAIKSEEDKKPPVMYNLDVRKAEVMDFTGETKNALKLAEPGRYRVTLVEELTHGCMSVEFYDSKGRFIACLNSFSPSTEIEMKKDEIFFRFIRFTAATGSYEIKWDSI